MKTENKRRSRIIRLVLLMAVLAASQTVGFETSWKLQTVNATLSSSSAFQYIVTILMENNGLCDVTPSIVSGCNSSSIPAPYLTTLAQTYGFSTHYTAVDHPSEPNYVALFGGSTFGYTSDGYCCFQLNAPNLVDRLETAGLTWKAFAEDASGSGTCNFMPPRSGDHYPFIGFSDMKPSARCADMLTTTSPLDQEFVGALNGATLPNYVWLTPNDTDNMHSSSVAVGDAYLATLVPLILSSRMFTTQKAALFIVFDEGNDFCPTGNSNSDCVVAEWSGPAVKKAYSSSTSYNHYSYLSTLEANWNLPSLTSNDASATPMTEFFGTPPPPALSASFTYSPSSTQAGQPVMFTASASGGTSPFTFSLSFGDGSTGTGSLVTHTYSSAGSYTTALTVEDSSTPQQTATSQKEVSVTSPPPSISATFTVSPSSAEVGQSISFTASASGGAPPYSYSWSFGDGSAGTGLQVTYTYNSDGTYQVTLTVADSLGNTVTGVSPVVIGTAPLQAGFTNSPTSPQPSDSINFTASARGGTPPYSYSWDFGNGASATGDTAAYSYATAGSYTVTLTVIDSMNRSNNTTQSLTIYSPAQPDFRLNTDRSTLIAQPGSEQSLAITVTDSSGPSGTIRFNATISPSGPQISLDPANITLASQGSGSTNLNIDVASNTPPGPYWVQVNATNGSITHSITVQVDVAQNSQLPPTGQACQFCMGSTVIIAIIGLAGAVTLVSVQALRRRRMAEGRDSSKKEGLIRASRCRGRLLP
ncbi:hypothetical protein AUF62_00765 [archaeon 13_1_20CM_52_20]|nr:MAG: hypothetical protein AUF62_00765 [archaeon 13_1_20CM_52_20]